VGRIALRTVVGLVLLLGARPEASAAGWTQPAGGVYLKVWDRTLVGTQAILLDSERGDTGATYQDHALNYYLEYGLVEGWTLVSTGRPFGWARFGDEATAYMGEVQVGVRRALVRGGVNLAAEARYGYAPDLGAKVIGRGVADGVAFVYAPTVETHGVDGELQLGVGFPWGWYTASAGVRWLSGEGLDPVLHAHTGVGYRFAFGLVVDVYAALHQPLGEVEAVNVAGAGQTRFVGLGLDLAYWLDEHWALALGVGSVVFAESNAATPALTVGFAYSGGR
jgi:hypothetical protein